MTLRSSPKTRSSRLPFSSRCLAASAGALLAAATAGCDSPPRRTVAASPAVNAPARSPAARADSVPASGESPSAPTSTGALASGPAPGATTPEKAACPSGFSCDRAAWGAVPRPRVDQIYVQKGPHLLHLVAGSTIVRTYSVALGWGGMGHKKYEGDGVTPVGTYKITDRIQSPWHTFLGVSYPSLEDQLEFPKRRARGEVPPGVGIGFGIGLHGHGKSQSDGEHKRSDWTLGCIALDNGEIDEVADVAKRGTKIVIVD